MSMFGPDWTDTGEDNMSGSWSRDMDEERFMMQPNLGSRRAKGQARTGWDVMKRCTQCFIQTP